MAERFDPHSHYDPDRPAWRQDGVVARSTLRTEPEGAWMKFVTVLGWLNIVGYGLCVTMFVGLGAYAWFANALGPMLIATLCVLLVFSMFGIRVGQGLIDREGWARLYTMVVLWIGFACLPCSFLPLLMGAPAAEQWVAQLGAQAIGLVVALPGLLFNAISLYALHRDDVRRHFVRPF